VIAFTVVEDLALIAELALVVGLLAIGVIAGWRGIKIIVIHRRENGS
jgi:hypothetical protein